MELNRHCVFDGTHRPAEPQPVSLAAPLHHSHSPAAGTCRPAGLANSDRSAATASRQHAGAFTFFLHIHHIRITLGSPISIVCSLCARTRVASAPALARTCNRFVSVQSHGCVQTSDRCHFELLFFHTQCCAAALVRLNVSLGPIFHW